MIRLYNTLTRKVDIFEPLDKEKKTVSLYTCGPTVYNYAHIGNLRTYVFEDILKRTLKFGGYQVKHVMNVTDVGHLVSDADSGDDKMELSAAREKKTVWEIAEFYFQAFRKDMKELHLSEPVIWCKATEHISDQIEMIQRIEEKGYTYIIEDGVYFDTSLYREYGILTGQRPEDLMGGARIEMVKGKKNVTDFALWKFSPKNQQRLMEWDSPWGIGFPGWHIECSTMATKYLGERIDIHCGGIDHIAIHHTNEIAQAESVLEHRWVERWMHGEFLVFGKSSQDETEKMSKSKGNFITLNTIIEREFDPLAYRYFCLNAHYRSPLTFTWEALDGAARAYNKLKKNIISFKEHSSSNTSSVIKTVIKEFTDAINDDLNMPRALAVMWGLLKNSDFSDADKFATLIVMDEVLGFDFQSLHKTDEKIDDEIIRLVELREKARKQKDFQEADRLRDNIILKGYSLEDTPQGTKVKRIT